MHENEKDPFPPEITLYHDYRIEISELLPSRSIKGPSWIWTVFPVCHCHQGSQLVKHPTLPPIATAYYDVQGFYYWKKQSAVIAAQFFIDCLILQKDGLDED